MKFIEIEIYVRRNNDKLQSQKPSINYYNSVDAKQLNFFFFFLTCMGVQKRERELDPLEVVLRMVVRCRVNQAWIF